MEEIYNRFLNIGPSECKSLFDVNTYWSAMREEIWQQYTSRSYSCDYLTFLDEFGRCALIVCCENYESLTPLDGLSHRAKELLEPLKEAGWQGIASVGFSFRRQ